MGMIFWEFRFSVDPPAGSDHEGPAVDAPSEPDPAVTLAVTEEPAIRFREAFARVRRCSLESPESQ